MFKDHRPIVVYKRKCFYKFVNSNMYKWRNKFSVISADAVVLDQPIVDIQHFHSGRFSHGPSRASSCAIHAQIGQKGSHSENRNSFLMHLVLASHCQILKSLTF